MSENISPTSPAGSESNWEQLFECALVERDPVAREQRLQNAKDAIMDRIEDSFDTASGQESRLLLAALNTISELQRVAKNDDLRRPGLAQTFGHPA
jgi:predicted transcriptional regulator